MGQPLPLERYRVIATRDLDEARENIAHYFWTHRLALNGTSATARLRPVAAATSDKVMVSCSAPNPWMIVRPRASNWTNSRPCRRGLVTGVAFQAAPARCARADRSPTRTVVPSTWTGTGLSAMPAHGPSMQ